MTKRPNPFDDFPPIQYKTHLNSKHVASKEDMQEVYRTTMARMMEGSRRAFGNDKKLTTDHPALTNGTGDHSCNGMAEKGKMKGEVLCRCCKSEVYRRAHVTCSYCRYPVCQESCVHECCMCAQTFCQFCAVLNYDKPEVRAFCMECLEQFKWS